MNYLRRCENCVMRPTGPLQKLGISDSIKDKFTGVVQVEGQVKVQVTEHSFIYRSGTIADRKDLGYRQIYAYAMRHYPYMPKEAAQGKNIVKGSTTKADNAILRRFADLAYHLGFESDEIIALQQYPGSEAEEETFN
jgi:hypothetical protein